MAIRKYTFLLDENVDAKLLQFLQGIEITATTVQKEGWGGYRNGQLSQLLKDQNIIFLTRDRDFQFLWEKYQLKIIYFLIEPPTAENLWEELQSLLENWKVPLDGSFLIRLQRGVVRVSTF